MTLVLHSIYQDRSQTLFYLVSQERAQNSKSHCQAAQKYLTKLVSTEAAGSATFNLCSQFHQVVLLEVRQEPVSRDTQPSYGMQ